MKKYIPSIILLCIFEIVAVTLWITMDNLFYMINFTYIGVCISIGLALFVNEKKVCKKICSICCRILHAYLSWGNSTRKYADRGLLVLFISRSF